MHLSQRPLYEDDPLPAPEWAERVVAVIHANGRLTDDTYDDYDTWMTALAEATRGAIYSFPSGRFEYVWADYCEAETRERAAALIAAGDFDAIARWVGELAAEHAATEHEPDVALARLCWIEQLVRPVLEQRIAAGDAAVASTLVALHGVLGMSLDALVTSAAALPALAEDGALQAIAAKIAAAKLRALSEVLPQTLDELAAILDGVLLRDQLSLLRFDYFTAPSSDSLQHRQELVVALARSGRALPEALMERLTACVYYVEELRSEPGRVEFTKHGEFARRLAAKEARTEVESKVREERIQRESSARAAEARRENDAYYGRARKRPRTPDDIVVLVCAHRSADAIKAYRARFPEIADQAEQAIEDVRAYFAP